MADVRERVLALLESVRGYGVAPARSPGNRFMYDSWNSILKPSGRAPAFVVWLRELGASANWEKDSDGRATGLRPAHWPMAVRNLSGLHAGLGGALFQYLRARPVWKAKVFVGPQTVPGGTTGSEADIEKHHEAQKKRLEELRKRMEAAYRKILDQIAKDLGEMQKRLDGDRDLVVDLFRDLSRVEQRRLKALAARLPAPDRKRAGAALERMGDLGEDAGAVAPFANTLMKWMQARTKVQAAVGERT